MDGAQQNPYSHIFGPVHLANSRLFTHTADRVTLVFLVTWSVPVLLSTNSSGEKFVTLISKCSTVFTSLLLTLLSVCFVHLYTPFYADAKNNAVKSNILTPILKKYTMHTGQKLTERVSKTCCMHIRECIALMHECVCVCMQISVQDSVSLPSSSLVSTLCSVSLCFRVG